VFGEFEVKFVLKKGVDKMKKGYSEKINDPSFKRYQKNANKYALTFSLILCAVAVVGFFIYGETSVEMDNPQALYIGIGIGAMFVSIALIQVIQRAKSKTWDGVVTDKKIEEKRRKKYIKGTTLFKRKYYEEYVLYTVHIKGDDGHEQTLSSEDDRTVYDYYKIGDKVRHHKGLNTFEKYDKTGDEIIFCNACASLNDINDDVCHRCGAPLLK
jgi:hypothetical protein